jgi:hypothetical protein
MSIRCSEPGQPDCKPICKRMDDVRGTMSNATYSDISNSAKTYNGWEAGKPGSPGLVVIQEWSVCGVIRFAQSNSCQARPNTHTAPQRITHHHAAGGV